MNLLKLLSILITITNKEKIILMYLLVIKGFIKYESLIFLVQHKLVSISSPTLFKSNIPLEPPKEYKHISDYKKQKILIVDDDPISKKVLENILCKEEFIFYTVHNGQDALELIKKEKEIDIVLLDVRMKSSSGYEFCRHIKKNFTANEKPVIMLTSRKAKMDYQLAFEAGANDYLIKPYNTMELLSRIRNLAKLRKTIKANYFLESSNKMKTRLLHMASHSLKNPLSIIKMNFLLLFKNTKPGGSHDKLISPIFRALDKMQCLIREFLENALIEDGKLNLNLEEANLNRLLNKAIGELNILAKKKPKNNPYK